MKFLLVLAALFIASTTASYNHCNQYHDQYMYSKCQYCAETYRDQYVCRSRKSHFTYDPYDVNVHSPHGRQGYGYGYKVNVYTDGDYYENHDDPSCFWQCDEYGQAFAKPCPYGQRFDRYARVCVSGPGNVRHGNSGYGNVHGGYQGNSYNPLQNSHPYQG
ncbi:uncharacterized protein LOC106168877 [Lingula anatina]|uniref:Uncharacterized protein LOC106168877 n=1 Tax=Lingula anatina TaxID=7574 RepID=A0A1S3IZV8_LINAN|nr:uncharacterized protein LOC106168877 [Lingula anatina]|eukprot:XP_013403548.1 uncharacterized protein LOC106168877 [Lingula anatina]